ncbi:hypothetical protein QAD02_008307 [Eretmocerus hayati]|uniref:Uncharacterized protein n=1 Tax=Eretmocerus hayati TaxID=131215 RepID=A0ACC2NAH2_9HYME|nr:hypothetical protein QAD02_008307 [Eretmocerus hayati]
MEQGHRRAPKRRNQASVDGTGKIPRRTDYRKRKTTQGPSRDTKSSDDETKQVDESYLQHAVDIGSLNNQAGAGNIHNSESPCHNQTHQSNESCGSVSQYSIPAFQDVSSNSDEDRKNDSNATDSSKETIDGDETYNDCLDVDPNWDEALFNKPQPKEQDRLRDLLTNEEWNMPIQVPVAASKAEVLMAILKLSLKHNWCLSETSDVLQMLNSLFVRSFSPETPYFLKNFFGNAIGVELYPVCPSCKLLVRKFDAGEQSVHCNHCDLEIVVSDPSFNNFFAVMDCKNQIRALIEENSDYYSNVMNKKSNNGTVFRDISDGELWENLRNSLSEEDQKHFGSALFNCDAAPAFETSKYSITPYQFVLNETPQHVRVASPVTAAIYFGKDKPDEASFTKVFIEKANDLSKNGVKCTIKNEEVVIKISFVCACIDSVARAPAQGVIQYNGECGCNWCLNPCVWIYPEKDVKKGKKKEKKETKEEGGCS